MKKIYLFLMLLFVGVGMAFAHDKDSGKREKMFKEVQEFKMKYLAQEMDLSELQKKKFFEVYEEMTQAKQECYGPALKLKYKLKHEKNASEEEYQKVTEAFNTANARWAEKEKNYDEKFSEFLTQKQIYKMKEGEVSFKAKLEEMKHNRKKDHKKPEKR